MSIGHFLWNLNLWLWLLRQARSEQEKPNLNLKLCLSRSTCLAYCKTRKMPSPVSCNCTPIWITHISAANHKGKIFPSSELLREGIAALHCNVDASSQWGANYWQPRDRRHRFKEETKVCCRLLNQAFRFPRNCAYKHIFSSSFVSFSLTTSS